LPNPHVIRFEEFELDRQSGELWRDGSRVLLPDQPFRLLAHLIREHGHLVTREELHRQLWPGDTFVDFEPSLNAAVRRLREALGDSAVRPRFIETLPRRGYRFVAPVIEVASPGTAVPAAPLVAHAPAGLRAPPSRLRAAVGAARSIRVSRLLLATLAAAAGVSMAWKFSPTWPRAPVTDGPVVRLTSVGDARLASLAPDGRRLAFVRVDGVRESLWLRRLTGSGAVQLLSPRDGTFRSLTFGPDDFVYFTFFQPDRTPVGLYRVSVRGGAPEPVSYATGGISFSPVGTGYAYVSNVSVSLHESRVVIADTRDGSSRVLALRTPPDSFLRTPPAWSPDGRRLALFGVSDRIPSTLEILTLGVEDGRVLHTVPLHLQSVERALWLPDASGFIVAGRERRGSPQRLWRVAAGSGTARPLTSDISDYGLAGISPADRHVVAVRGEVARSIWIAPVDDPGGARQVALDSGDLSGLEGIAWTPGGQLLYTGTDAGNVDIWRLAEGGLSRDRLTDDPAEDFHPAASPDGMTVVFASRRAGIPGLWAMSRTGADPRRLTTGADTRPAISPDGRWVVFERIGVDNTPFALWRVPLEGGQAECIGTPHSMRPAISPNGLSIAHYWMTPDKWMLAVTPAGSDLPAHAWPIRPTHLDRVVRWSADGLALVFSDQHGGASNLWRQSLEGQPPVKVTSFTEGVITTFDLSRDGSRLAWTRVHEVRDIVTVPLDLPPPDGR
jgi:Tol biopolymer transport system component/DNA-binding winged helix-turn-helix (wHTH) protein